MKIKPTLKRERELQRQGKVVAGIDEAGRGAWAGPVVVAAVILPSNHRQITDVKDSKMLTPKQRKVLYEKITTRALDFGVGVIDHAIIDKIGILEATKIGAREAVDMMQTKADHILVDALDLSNHLKCDQESIIKGDQNIYTISCASIIAKVTRDNLMSSLGGEYAKYLFFKHKGYGTKLHQKLLKEYGASDIHRMSFKPIKVLYE